MEDKFNKQNPFKVPEGYFEQLTERVEQRIADIEPLPEQSYFKRVVMPRLRPLLYVAAVVAIVYGIGFVATRPAIRNAQEQARVEAAAQESFDETVEFYYIDDMDLIDVYELVSLNE